MKTYIKHLCGLCLLCVLCGVSMSCQDGDWDAPDFSDGVPYGNNALTNDNIITIAQLKAQYPAYNAPFSNIEITNDSKLRVRVTGNDIQGNLYNSIAVQEDATGDALLVCISGSDLFAMMPVGQELIIDLKGLYFGCYGAQPQLGTPYTNARGNTFPSRMDAALWEKHVKLIGTADPSKVAPIDFPDAPTLADAGKLMTIKNVSIKGADGTTTWASKKDAGTQTSVTKYFNEKGETVMVYTSTYADFANTPIPTGKMNLTGVWKVYQTDSKYDPKWELIIRDAKDIDKIEN